MKSTHALHVLTLAALGCLAATPALAAQDGSYYYGGLSVGQTRAQFDEQRIANGLLGAGVTSSGITRDASDKGYKLFGGYQFNRYFGLEAGYFDLGRSAFSSSTTPAGTLDGQFKTHGLNLDLVGTLPLTERLSVLARVGAQRATTRGSFSGTGAASPASGSNSVRSTGTKYGAGLQYEFSPSFLVRGEVERYRVADATGGHGNVNLTSVSLVFPFGRSAAPAPRPQAAYVAPQPARVIEPPPAPVVAAAPVAPVVVPPMRRRVSFSAESLFTFDQSALRSEGKSALDTFAQELAGSQFDVITVEGHTDRLGSLAYNQTLSLQRAEAVKSYLVSANHVDANKVTAAGKGETSPQTRPGDCKGNAPSARLIACLQPDRRVEIEVVGTR